MSTFSEEIEVESDGESVNLPFDEKKYSDPNELLTHMEDLMEYSRVIGTDFSSKFELHGYFLDRDNLVGWTRFVGYSMNMVLVINKSWLDRRGFRIFHLACDRHGAPRKEKDVDPDHVPSTSRKKNSKKCMCMFELEVTQIEEQKWTLRVICGVHNHVIPSVLRGHAYAGRLTPAQYRKVERELGSGLKPRHILKSVQLDDPGNVTTIRKIYNTGLKMRMEQAEGRGSLQQALHTLKERGYYVSARRCTYSDEVADFFISHPDSRHLLHMFPYVIVMDSTYKTNEYNMPLLEIVGITSSKKTFAIAFVFMAHENRDHYKWALRRLRHLCYDKIPEVIATDRELGLIGALGEVFPEVKHILCMFHVKSNIGNRAGVVLRCKEVQAVFASQCHALFESRSSESYERRLTEMRVHWAPYPRLMNYLETTWLTPYKEAIVRSWCDLYHHFGTRTTNACESAHKLLKQTLDSSVGGFQLVCDNIHLMVTDQVQKIQASLEMSRVRIPREVRIPIFDLLRDYVTSECFTLLWDNYTKARRTRDDVVCRDSYWREAHGVPCVHDFIIAIRARRAITLNQIHPFWKQVHWIPVTFPNGDMGDDDDDDPINPSLVSLNRFRERMESNTLTPDEMEKMASCFEDIENPGSTTMKEPTQKARAKGRPPTMRSTRREPSSFEHSARRGPGRPRSERVVDPDDGEATPEASPRRGPGRPRGSQGKKAKHAEATPEDRLRRKGKEPIDVDATPEVTHDGAKYPWEEGEFRKFMEPYVNGAMNVLGDGNCGYRSIALVLGFSDEDFLVIRREILMELNLRRTLYSKCTLFNKFINVLKNVNWTRNAPCPSRCWMELPIVGCAAATYYKIALVVLGNNASTFLPMIASTPNQGPPTVIRTIAFVSDSTHFVGVWLKENAPLPEVDIMWTNHHDPSVDGWDAPFIERIFRYTELRRKECPPVPGPRIDVPDK